MRADLVSPVLPAEIVLHSSWWFHREKIVFDEDFYFHPAKRVETERRMERALYERWGKYGLGSGRGQDRAEVGPVHLAAGYIISGMLGCEIEYPPSASPIVRCANRDSLEIDARAAFQSPIHKKFLRLMDSLKTRYGSLCGDVNWSGVLNIALDLRGQQLFIDMHDDPSRLQSYFRCISEVIEGFTAGVSRQTGTTSISVNRTVRFFRRPVFLHSECSNTMISAADYEKFILPIDSAWSRRHRPFGVHHCGTDPHRFAASYARIPHLDFLDVGWGGDIAELRAHLPRTFFNIRLSPLAIKTQTAAEIRETIRSLVHLSGDGTLTGICCINMDQDVEDEKITAILETASELREEQEASGGSFPG
jgi:hypothetical protein